MGGKGSKSVATKRRDRRIRKIIDEDIGFDLSDEYHEMARKRLAEPSKNDLKKFSDETGVAATSDSDVFSLADS